MIYKQAKIAIENIKKQKPKRCGFTAFQEGAFLGTPWIKIMHRNHLGEMFYLHINSNDECGYQSGHFNENVYWELVRTMGEEEVVKMVERMALNFLSQFTK